MNTCIYIDFMNGLDYIVMNYCCIQLIEKHTEAVHKVLNYIKQWPEKEIGNFRIGSLLPILNHFHGDVYLNGKV